ncbi:12851_t:CDS:2 [Ambispora leptoticha]|uniref:12851_t:CDS:1 n=1 Tax=Ambispora leptoticha TaxID=144679 RepID=A0A9N9BTK0_9GLOM|nr:12851_t:CDS:2 [Ambispora leptoticha]
MAEKTDNKVCETIQTRGQDDKSNLFLINTNNNSMECNMSSLDVLYQSTFQKSNITRAEEISCKESGIFSQDSKDGTKYNIVFSESKSHVFIIKGESEEIHVCDISIKSENNADIAESFKYCPDQRAIHLLQVFFGELCRINTLEDTM